jgi:protein TonB
MSQKMNIYSDEWCDMIFTEKNHEYGAYMLRRSSGKRHMRATIIAIVFFTVAVSSPVLLKAILPKEKVENTDKITMADLKLDKPKEEEKIIDEPPPEPVKSSIKFVPPVIAPDEEVSDADQMKSQEELNKSDKAISTATVEGTDDPNAKLIGELDQGDATGGDGGLQPLTVVEQMPDFPGGLEELSKFLHDNIKYPQLAREDGTSGTVYITFVVSKSGKISNVKVLRGIGSGCDEEAIRVVRKMPDWKPGKQNGAAVPVQYNLPIKFNLQ